MHDAIPDKPPLPNGPIEGPSAWRARDMKRDKSWRYELSNSEIYVRSVERFPDVPRFTDAQFKAFDLITEIAEDPANHVAVPFKEGDIQLLDNHSMLHGRYDYRGWDDPEKRRYLLRLWICPPNGHPLPLAYAERYGNIDVGDRGGIVCKDTEFKAPLDPI